MNWKLILLYGLLFWVIIFVVASVAMFSPGLKDLPTAQEIIIWATDIILAVIFSRLYFNKVKASLGNGLLFGLGMLIVGTILDAAITVPLFVKDYAMMFGKWSLWVGYALVIVIGGIVGLVIKRKEAIKV